MQPATTRRQSSQIQLRAAAELERRRRDGQLGDTWPPEYRNVDTGKTYKPHFDDEARFVYEDSPKWALLKGGEGAGKSVAGIIKTLNRLKRKQDGIMVSPNLPHFKKSLWPEFQNWCPPEVVIPKHRHRLRPEWQPSKDFEMIFVNDAKLHCGGIENPSSWEGPNRHFAHIDEGRHASAQALTVLDGRIRLTGPDGEPPQGWITTTPKKNWLYDYFGPIQENDKFAQFKNNSLVVTLPVELNRENLAADYIENRRNLLTESEARVLMAAEWEDESDAEKFVNIFWWDACAEQLPPLSRSEPAILALDAAIGSETTSMLADCFAAIIVSRHPTRPDTTAVRYCGIWQAEVGKYLDFEPIETELYRLCNDYSILEVCYDVTQLHDMSQRMRKNGINAKVFSQQQARLVADKDLQAMIMGRRIAHDGNPLLRQHIDNADIKKSSEGIRLVKRSQSLKIDGAVSLAMASSRLNYFNI